MPNPLLWFTVEVGHRFAEIYLSCQAITETLNDCLGWTQEMPDGSIRVMIDCAAPRLIQYSTLCHELNHVANWGDISIEEAEDEAASSAIEALYPVFRNFGLCFPRRPKGSAALERYARTGKE